MGLDVTKIVSEYDQEIPQSQTADHPQHKCFQQLHLLALHLEIEGYTTLLLYLLLEFLSTGDLRGERRTFKWFLKRAESETPCKFILVAE